MASESTTPPSTSLYEGKALVVAAELRSLKPGAQVYERKSNLFFLSERSAVLEATEASIEAAKNADEDGSDD